MIDSSDSVNIEESRAELFKLLDNEELKNATVLIFANKQDIEKCQSVSELSKLYQLDKIRGQEWNIQVHYLI